VLLTIGSRLGPYEILATLGEGGMGEVYRARDSRLGREVAIKILQHGFSNSDGWARFEREARAASALSHPNICAVYDVGEADGRPFLVLELIEGVTLRHYIDNQPMEASAVLAVAIQIADALEAAHAKGIVHRDIKSSNVMIAGRRHVKVLDFGLAKQTAVAGVADAATREQLTMAGAVVGTPHYLAPELLRGAPADARSDVWAFGVVLYEMLAGHVPFRGSTPFAIGEAIVSEPLPPLPASVPAGLRAVVDRCLARRAADRYQHAGEVRAAFDTLQSGREPETPHVASGAPRRRLFPVKRAWWWAAGAVAAALVASVAVWLFSARPQVRLVSTGGPASSNQQANEAFELGMQFQTVQNDLERGRVALERAIQLDPQFAEARRFHALTSVFMILNGYSNDTSLLYRAEDELRATTAIDPTLTGLPSSYAAVYITQGRRELVPWAELERELQSDPRHPTNRLWKGIGLWLSGDIAGAKREFRTTLDFLPLFGAARMFYAETLRNEGDVGGAIQESITVLEQAPNNISAISWLTMAYLDTGDTTRARALLEDRRPEFAGNYLWRLAWALLLASEGQHQAAREAMDDQTLKFAAAAFPATIGVVEFYAVLGDTSRALEWLERTVRNGDERTAWFRRNPRLASIRQDPGFNRIIETVEARRKTAQP
jgi:tetratricopeptide (TPR) repeat protein